MENQDIQLLQEAASEIKRLRHTNEIMGARLQMFDSLMLLFNTRPDYPREGMSPDVVSAIEKRLKETLVG